MILIDTNIYVSYLNKRDKNHLKAKDIVKKILTGRFGNRYTISEVFSETATLLYRVTKQKEIVQKAWDLIYSKDLAWGSVVIVKKENIDKSWEIFSRYVTEKKPLSFVDCLLISVAREYEIDTIASFDREFDGILDRVY